MSLSNRQRRLLRKRVTKVSSKPSVAQVVGHAVVRLSDRETDYDALRKLYDRNVISKREWDAGCTYRACYSAAMAEGVPLQSCLGAMDMPGGGTGRIGQPPIVSATEAKQTLYWLRWVVLNDHPDTVEILNAVCGRGLSLMELSDRNSRIAGNLETALKIALGQCATALERRRAGRLAVAS